ncbi:MAG: hypothetical protein M9924_22000 [Rhizobiaceae bacterium]|nr:hypothetical protein [Rhizobiaceae bacterium]
MTLYCAKEFYNDGRVHDDRLLYVAPNGENVFVPDGFAANQKLPLALFTESGHAMEASRHASIRGGTLNVEEFTPDPVIPVSEISWLVGRIHVSTTNEDLFDDFKRRSNKATPATVLEICAIALAYHRANQHLYRVFAF